MLQSPKNNQKTRGTFFAALAGAAQSDRAPRSSNWSAIEGNVILVRGLDCLDETPLLDIKPDRCEFTPLLRRRKQAISRRSEG